MAAPLLGPISHTYTDEAEIIFVSDEVEGLSVVIKTSRLYMRSVQATQAEFENYASLFGDAVVMEKFGTGKPQTREHLETRIRDVWAQRWLQHDPYAGLAVFKGDTHEFLGHVVLEHGDRPGESELAYIFHQKYWNQGYATEAVRAIVQEYAPATVKEGYTLDGKPLEKILATARFDNVPSIRVLEKVGMKHTHGSQAYGALRNHYAVDLKVRKRCFCTIL